MLGTFDLAGVEVGSPDEILASLDPAPIISRPDDPPNASRIDDRAVAADTPVVEDAESDEILRELEEHHRRGQASVRPSRPRGSAELEPVSRHNASRASEREVRSRLSGESSPRGARKRVGRSLAAAAVFTTTARAVTWKQWQALRASAGEAIAHGRWRTWAIAGAVVLSAATVTVVGIATEVNSGARKPRATAGPAATPTSSALLDIETKALIDAPGHLERQLRTSERAHRAASARAHSHRRTHARARAVSPRRAVTSTQGSTPVAAPASTSSTSSTSSTYTSSTSSPAPTTPHPAATYTHQEAGPTSLGSQVGTGCDPTCH